MIIAEFFKDSIIYIVDSSYMEQYLLVASAMMFLMLVTRLIPGLNK